MASAAPHQDDTLNGPPVPPPPPRGVTLNGLPVPPPPHLVRCDCSAQAAENSGTYQYPSRKAFLGVMVMTLLVEALPPSVKKALLDEASS